MMTDSKTSLPIVPAFGRTSLPPSIFNDVIGPVMRGPSSSHCAAAVRIGRMARDLMGGEVREILVEFHPQGSLATTHKSQGSDMGLFGGLLGWEATDDRLIESSEAIREAGIEVEIKITDYPAVHPNTYKMTLSGPEGRHTMTAISSGGGMVEVLEIDGLDITMVGDFFETLVWIREEGEGAWDPQVVVDEIEGLDSVDGVFVHPRGDGSVLQIRGTGSLPEPDLEKLSGLPQVELVRSIGPVLPTLSRSNLEVPFLDAAGLLESNEGEGATLWELALRYESARGQLDRDAVWEEMDRIVEILEASIQQGLAGTDYADRILGPQAGAFRQLIKEGRLLNGGVLDTVIPYVTALMEVKSAMGVIVAAPTAGACGALPGACIGAGHAMGAGRDKLVQGMLAAGMVGVFIAAQATFAAEVCGCQAECGAGSAMAAAALVTLGGGSAEQALAAASMALQNTLGMICDPVANRVEIPCLGRNVMAASNALASANMALAGFDAVIPLDEVIQTMYDVGNAMPSQLRCTALGGLSVTPTSKRIQASLEEG